VDGGKEMKKGWRVEIIITDSGSPLYSREHIEKEFRELFENRGSKASIFILGADRTARIIKIEEVSK
jgi:hypothetical protein